MSYHHSSFHDSIPEQTLISSTMHMNASLLDGQVLHDAQVWVLYWSLGWRRIMAAAGRIGGLQQTSEPNAVSDWIERSVSENLDS
jgi:hypothetical protein